MNSFETLTWRWASLVAPMVKNLPIVQETRVQSLAREDPLEKGMATHSSILAWRIPWTEEPGRLQSMESQRAGHDWVTNNSNNYCSQSSAPWILCIQQTHSRELPFKQMSWICVGRQHFNNYSICLVTIPYLLKSFKIFKSVNTF